MKRVAKPARNAKQIEDAAYERAVAHADARRAALLASDPTILRYGDELPERDCYRINLHREEYGGGFVASFWPFDLELEFRLRYGAHHPDALWSYTAPAGAKAVLA